MFKFRNKIFSKIKRPVYQQAGMTYVELIVVLSIFSVITSVVMFNFKAFQAKTDIKNLANDIALRIVQAQKYSVNGKLPPVTPQQTDIITKWGDINLWKPSYGVYFDTAIPKKFIYFVDIDKLGNAGTTGNGLYDGGSELLENININNGNYISSITAQGCGTVNNLSIVFARPDSEAKFFVNFVPCFPTNQYVDIGIKSPALSTIPVIRVYSFGKIEII